MLAACSDGPVDEPEQTVADVTVKDAPEHEATGATATDMPEYKILEDTVRPDIKRTVKVQLPSRTDEDTLRVLAANIYALSNVNVERTFISYTIADNDPGQSYYWATTDYDPDLRIIIYGETASDYEKTKNKNAVLPLGELVGSWMVSRGSEYKMVAYKKDGKVYIHNVFGDDSPSDELYELSEQYKGTWLESYEGKKLGEYFVINKEGDLEFWSDSGNYYTAPKT